MVFMAMGKEITADMIPFPHQIGDIRNHQVHSQHVFLGEHAAAVYDDDVIFVFKNIHVFAYFVHTTKRDNPQP